MRRFVVAVTLSLFLSVLSQCGWAEDDPNFVRAKNIVSDWFAAMLDKELDKVGAYMAPNFVSIHGDGVVRDKAQELQLVKAMNMPVYHLTNFKFKSSANTITVIFACENITKANKKPNPPKMGYHMIVLQKDLDQWLIISYANLDPYFDITGK